jgi:threonylcarbamoyladenosine tRNA methylthiotransferase MtaB
MESVILVTGNKEKARMPELLADLGFQADGAQQLPGRPERTRPSVKIQEGCDSFCSYCIVPIVRGAPISFPHGRIIEQVRALTAEGAKEIVFTGTHLGLYNDQGIRLHDLLRQAIEIPGDFRLRISSLEPMGIAPELIELVAKHPKICPHLHISFQSFSNPVLNAMGRPYTVEFIVDLLERIRSANPRLRIGCDLIVGFPDETEALFDETCMRVRDLPVHYGHEFRFSPRPGTKAEHLAPRVPKAESIRRSEVLRQILSGKHKAFVESETGQIATVLVEDTEDRSGFTANYLRVKLEGEELLEKNRFYPARITGSENSRVSAVIVTRDP